MTAKRIAILITTLLVLSGEAIAQDSGGFKLFGSFGAGGLGSSRDSRDASKIEEYRDLSDGPFGVFDVRGRGNRFYFDAFGENLGRDDMFIKISGGMYGIFQFSLHGDWLTHNFGFGPDGARSPYIGIGQHTLPLFSTNLAELRNLDAWTTFDFSTDRRDVGGDFEFSGKSPWYVLVDGNRVHQEGINKVDAAALGTSPGNGFVDLPYPVHHSTTNISVEGGYESPRGHFSVNWIESNFRNDSEFLYFQNPFFGFGMDTSTFAPNNDYTRISASGMLRNLPLDSILSGRVTYDRITDDAEMVSEVLNTSGSSVLTPTNPSSPIFEGKVENVTAQVSFTSTLARNLDTRAYYNYYRRHNTSTDIVFDVTTAGLVCFEAGTTSPANVNVPCTGERYGYTKNNAGFETEYRASGGNRISAGLDYLDINRDRFDSAETGESKVFVQWSNNLLESLTARFKYQYMWRRSEFLTDNAGYDANSPFYLERFNRSFDVANLNQHLVKAYFDYSPVQFLDLGFEAYYKKNDYEDFILGRMNDQREEFQGSIAYGDPEKYRLALFADVEFIRYDSYHRTINASPCPSSAPNCFDPTIPPTSTAFNWGARLKDKNWMIEFSGDWPITPKLTLRGSAIVEKSRGRVDFESQRFADGTPAAALYPIYSYDNIERRSVSPKAIYLPVKNLELTVGYSYERYAYTDAQFEGYQYTIGTGTTTSYLSGIYAFPDYRAHIGYGSLRYIF